MEGELTESKFDPKTFDFDTILNYQLSQKLKLIGRDKFNHLINILTGIMKDDQFCQVNCRRNYKTMAQEVCEFLSFLEMIKYLELGWGNNLGLWCDPKVNINMPDNLLLDDRMDHVKA